MSSQPPISFCRKEICHGVRCVYHDCSIQETIVSQKICKMVSLLNKSSVALIKGIFVAISLLAVFNKFIYLAEVIYCFLCI